MSFPFNISLVLKNIASVKKKNQSRFSRGGGNMKNGKSLIACKIFEHELNIV